MIKIVTIQEIRALQIAMLDYIDLICRKNKIKYSLAGGTLLGAVRHKGYIPWDDDIDILLLREEYQRLMEILAMENQYNLITINTPNYYLPYSKICEKKTKLREPLYPNIVGMGVYIDIFPIDNLPQSINEIMYFRKKLLWERRKLIYSIPRLYYQSNSSTKRIIKKILFAPYALYCKHIGTNMILRRIDQLMKKYNTIESEKAGFLLSQYGMREVMPKRIFYEYTDIIFEGKKYMAIKDYNFYLIRLYGNYMELPPIEKRITHHNYEAVWEENE